MTSQSDKITFKAWFFVREDNSVQMVDTALPPDEDEERFGPFQISIRMPEPIRNCLAERSRIIAGIVKEPTP